MNKTTLVWIIEKLEKFEGYQIIAKTYGREYQIKIWYMLDGYSVPACASGGFYKTIEEAYNSAIQRLEEKTQKEREAKHG